MEQTVKKLKTVDVDYYDKHSIKKRMTIYDILMIC